MSVTAIYRASVVLPPDLADALGGSFRFAEQWERDVIELLKQFNYVHAETLTYSEHEEIAEFHSRGDALNWEQAMKALAKKYNDMLE